MSVTLAILATSPDLQPQAEVLATQLNLPLANPLASYDYRLELTSTHLMLVKPHSNMTPLFVDFQSGKLTYRRLHVTFRHESLVRALGLKNNTHPRIVDATAGLGRDSFMLACLGFHLTLLERSPIIHALLNDGLKRAGHNPELKIIINKMHLIHADTLQWLQQTNEAPNIIYLDPMFPGRKKTAAVKKEMQLFQDIIGADADADTLLHDSLACATDRVVVKRPRLADPIAGPRPSFFVTGRSSRFDVYLI